MTLHRFLEPLKNQFTHFGYEEKAATQATQGLGQWGWSPTYGSCYWDTPSKLPRPQPHPPAVEHRPQLLPQPAQSFSFPLLTLPTLVLELLLLQVWVGAPVSWVAIQTRVRAPWVVQEEEGPLPEPGPAPPAVSPLPQGQVSLPQHVRADTPAAEPHRVHSSARMSPSGWPTLQGCSGLWGLSGVTMSVLSRPPRRLGASETTFPGQQLPLPPLAGQSDGMGVLVIEPLQWM